jgi:hypothetical protein
MIPVGVDTERRMRMSTMIRGTFDMCIMLEGTWAKLAMCDSWDAHGWPGRKSSRTGNRLMRIRRCMATGT